MCEQLTGIIILILSQRARKPILHPRPSGPRVQYGFSCPLASDKNNYTCLLLTHRYVTYLTGTQRPTLLARQSDRNNVVLVGWMFYSYSITWKAFHHNIVLYWRKSICKFNYWFLCCVWNIFVSISHPLDRHQIIFHIFVMTSVENKCMMLLLMNATFQNNQRKEVSQPGYCYTFLSNFCGQ